MHFGRNIMSDSCTIGRFPCCCGIPHGAILRQQGYAPAHIMSPEISGKCLIGRVISPKPEKYFFLESGAHCNTLR
jgi:hypothetical protein